MDWQQELGKILSEGVLRARQREQNTLDIAAGGSADSIVLYGAGNLGRQTLKGLRQHGIEPLAFSDLNSSLWGTQIDAVPVLSPEDAVARFGKTALFVVCIWNPNRKRGVQSIMDYVSGLGAERVAPFVWLFWKYPEDFLPYYFWDLPSRILAQADGIRNAAAEFSEHSKEAFVRHLKFRVFGDFSCLPPPAQEPTYFPKDILNLRTDECFVDCGAFDGDTIREFARESDGQFSRIIAFEPDPATAQALRSQVSNREDIGSKTVIHPSVLGATPGKVHFQACGLLVSAVCEEGGIEVDCTTLDHTVRSAMPTFIKMDIEGSEIAALEGGRRTIAENQPVLAICVYHRPDDFWRIPLLMRELEPASSLELRMYWMDAFDTVCYAIPPERMAAPATTVRKAA